MRERVRHSRFRETAAVISQTICESIHRDLILWGKYWILVWAAVMNLQKHSNTIEDMLSVVQKRR